MDKKKCAVMGLLIFFGSMAGLLFAESPKKMIMGYTVETSPLPQWFGEGIQQQAGPAIQKFILSLGHLPASVKSEMELSTKNPKLFRYHLNVKVSLEGAGKGPGAPEYRIIRKWTWTDMLTGKQKMRRESKETILGDCLGSARAMCTTKISGMMEKDLKETVSLMMGSPPTENIPKQVTIVPQWPGQTPEQYKRLEQELMESQAEEAADKIQQTLEKPDLFDGKDIIKR